MVVGSDVCVVSRLVKFICLNEHTSINLINANRLFSIVLSLYRLYKIKMSCFYVSGMRIESPCIASFAVFLLTKTALLDITSFATRDVTIGRVYTLTACASSKLKEL